jgi:hypothetical protein
MLLNLTAAGFDLFWLPDGFTRTGAESRSIADPLPTLQTITAQNLAYDLWDAHAYRCVMLCVGTQGKSKGRTEHTDTH